MELVSSNDNWAARVTLYFHEVDVVRGNATLGFTTTSELISVLLPPPFNLVCFLYFLFVASNVFPHVAT